MPFHRILNICDSRSDWWEKSILAVCMPWKLSTNKLLLTKTLLRSLRMSETSWLTDLVPGWLPWNTHFKTTRTCISLWSFTLVEICYHSWPDKRVKLWVFSNYCRLVKFYLRFFFEVMTRHFALTFPTVDYHDWFLRWARWNTWLPCNSLQLNNTYLDKLRALTGGCTVAYTLQEQAMQVN